MRISKSEEILQNLTSAHKNLPLLADLEMSFLIIRQQIYSLFENPVRVSNGRDTIFHVFISFYLSHPAFALQVKLLEDQAKDLGKEIINGCPLRLCDQVLLDPGSHRDITFS